MSRLRFASAYSYFYYYYRMSNSGLCCKCFPFLSFGVQNVFPM